MKRILSIFMFLLFSHSVFCNFITAGPSNYTTFLSGLQPGDTLYLLPGNYLNQLNINYLNGTSQQPIVILGSSQAGVVFLGNACCNTVSITQSSYIVMKNFTIDGQNVPNADAVKGEGTNGNWAHHITIEYLKIIGQGANQQTVGISTKCTTWDWIIRRNIIDGAGTGLYLGNSNGDAPFVNGIIEGNWVNAPIGYCMEIKHQNDNLRTISGMTLNGKTIIRYNVWCKGANSSTGSNARPNVLLGAFPSTGNGTNDVYEVYGNFFYNNPVEALLQVTGNSSIYSNVFVNPDPGGWGVQVREQNLFQPRSMNVFHNTIIAASGTGLNFYNCNTSFLQYGVANAVFASPQIVANTAVNISDNVTDTYLNSANYMYAPLVAPPGLQTYPLNGQLIGTLVSNAQFTVFTDNGKDLAGNNFTWTFRGAYSAPGPNYGWNLICDTMPFPAGFSTGLSFQQPETKPSIYFDHSTGLLQIRSDINISSLELFSIEGKLIRSFTLRDQKNVSLYISEYPSGIYILKAIMNNQTTLGYKLVL